jgi:homoserine kinase
MTGAAARHGRRLPPFALRVENRIPIGRGLGSSAAAVLAGVAAADFLCRLDLSEAELLAAATEVEGHPDNVAAALLGGLVASVSAGTVLSSRIEFAARWSIVVAIPDFALSTREARAALPAEVPHRDAVFNVQRAAFLIAQLARGRREGVREAMRDRLHQPYRSRLVPGLAEILALDGVPGLVGIALSGAGPSVLAFADGEAEAIGARLRATFAAHGVSAEVRILEPDNAGLVREAREGGAA